MWVECTSQSAFQASGSLSRPSTVLLFPSYPPNDSSPPPPPVLRFFESTIFPCECKVSGFLFSTPFDFVLPVLGPTMDFHSGRWFFPRICPDLPPSPFLSFSIPPFLSPMEPLYHPPFELVPPRSAPGKTLCAPARHVCRPQTSPWFRGRGKRSSARFICFLAAGAAKQLPLMLSAPFVFCYRAVSLFDRRFSV